MDAFSHHRPSGNWNRRDDMTQATEIMAIARNADHACKLAEDANASVDQNWEKEATIYGFEDESALIVSGAQVNAFESMELAQEAL
jgi:hypothetical protein